MILLILFIKETSIKKIINSIIIFLITVYNDNIIDYYLIKKASIEYHLIGICSLMKLLLINKKKIVFFYYLMSKLKD